MHAPLAHTIKDACALTGLGRSTIYSAIKEGRLKPRKCGNRTLILHDDLRAFVIALPTRAA